MQKTKTRSGLGLLEVLGVVFLTLKLLGLISWSWWAVLAPFWVPVLLMAILLIIAFVVGKAVE